MAAKAEDLVAILNRTTSLFELSGDLAEFQQGISDIVARLRALERAAKPANMPNPALPRTT